MDHYFSHTAILVLAAGRSARMGSPKQLLDYKGKSLLRHTVDEALQTGCEAVFVVLGSNRDIIRKELEDSRVSIIDNTGWEEGMASSIRCGLDYVQTKGLQKDNVMILVCDQPFITHALLHHLLEKHLETGKPIIASNYEGVYGTPALFHQTFFSAWMELKGDKGAQSIITSNKAELATVEFPRGITDIDTEEDYELLKK